MRIALLALHYAEYASRLAIALSVRHEVLLLLGSNNARGELTPRLRARAEEAARVRYVEARRMRDPRVPLTALSINRVIRRFAPHVVHAQEVHPLLNAATILAFRGKVPVILT
ncbi:MAG TPA: glycosyltransferase, partial [Steroidobacteraceae bacterium]|nr:glycosyltransferase [Steroidobacteraceae bacterium]